MILLNGKKINIFSEKDKINFNKEKKIKTLSEQIYKYEHTINFEYIECPCCHSDHLVSYGSYARNVVIFDKTMTINIKRVLCKKCGRTHALIPDFIKPFFQYESSFIDYNILLINVRNKKNKQVEFILNVSRQLLRTWKIRFGKHRDYICTTFKVSAIRDVVHQIFCDNFNTAYIYENGMRYFS